MIGVWPLRWLWETDLQGKGHAEGVEAPVCGQGTWGSAASVSRRLQESNHQAEVRTVDLLSDCRFLALGWGRVLHGVLTLGTTASLCATRSESGLFPLAVVL